MATKRSLKRKAKHSAYEEVLAEASKHLSFSHPLMQWLYHRTLVHPDTYDVLEQRLLETITGDTRPKRH